MRVIKSSSLRFALRQIIFGRQNFVTFISLTFRRNLSNASFKLNMRRRSRMFAARRCANDATRRRVFFVDTEPLPLLFGAGNAPRGDKRCETSPPICERGHRAAKK